MIDMKFRVNSLRSLHVSKVFKRDVKVISSTDHPDHFYDVITVCVCTIVKVGPLQRSMWWTGRKRHTFTVYLINGFCTFTLISATPNTWKTITNLKLPKIFLSFVFFLFISIIIDQCR